MPKVVIVFFLLLFNSFTATAQWWRLWPMQREPLLPSAKSASFDLREKLNLLAALPFVAFERSPYNYEVTEAAIMKTLYHNLRFHNNPEIIVGFNNLIDLYKQQNRFSEAKWYLLQCNEIFRKQKDDAGLIASLMSLGMLKADIGEYVQAREDLMEARGIAVSGGHLNDLFEIEKKLHTIELKKRVNVKNELKYAEVPDLTKG